MKTNLTIVITLIITAFLFNVKSAKSETGTGTKSAELNTQIIQEIKEVLRSPYLKFESKDLSGEVKITTSIDKNGKIIFKEVKGLNKNLTENVKQKLNSLNLWASPDYSGKIFQYNLKYKN